MAVTVTEGSHFVAFHVLVPAKSKIVAALFRYCHRPVVLDDADVEMPFERQ